MNIAELVPPPQHRDAFRRNRVKYIPNHSGCYVLTSFVGSVLYVGLTNNLRKRMNNHLDDRRKTGVTKDGRAVFFWWLECSEINKVERTWMNIHVQHEGLLPPLNNAYSPVVI